MQGWVWGWWHRVLGGGVQGVGGCVMAQGGRAGPGVGALDIIFKAIDIFF